MEAKNNNRVPTEQATHLSCDMEEKNATLQQELEKARELISQKEKAITDLSNCLEGSTGFLDRLIKDGAIDEESLIFAFIKTQIESNRMTLKTYSPLSEGTK